MNLSRLITRRIKWARKHLNKNKELKRFIVTMIAVWLIIPVVAVQAATPINQSVTVEPIQLDQQLKKATINFSVEIKDSCEKLLCTFTR